MALPCADLNIDLFVDRDAEKMKLEQMVSFSVDQKSKEKPRDYQRVAHLVGKSRVGKSYLLCNFNKHLESKNIHRVGLSFANINGLNDDQFIFNILNSLYDQLAPYIVGQLRNRNDLAINALSDLFVEEIAQLEKKNLIVFLFDEVSMLSRERIQLLEDYVIARVLILQNVIVVLSGRHLITVWKEFALRPLDNLNIIELDSFDFENTQKQIQKINPNLIHLVGEIYEVSGGSPGNNKKIVEQLGEPPIFDELSAIRTCNQEFSEVLASASDGQSDSVLSELLPSLEALCVLQDFDKEYEMPLMLSVHPVLVGSWTVQRCSNLLNILSEIRIGPGKLVAWSMEKNALVIEEQTRFNLEKELMIRDIDLWKTLHRAAMKMYDEWSKEYGADSIFADKADFHKTQLIKVEVNPEISG